MNKKEEHIKLSLDRLHDIRVLLSRLFWGHKELHKDIELLLFYIYQDGNEVDETIKKGKEVIKNMI